MTKDKVILLMIGNSRLHWALFNNNSLINLWDTPHLSEKINQNFINNCFPENLDFSELLQQNIIINLASVVPNQLIFWQDYPQLNLINLQDIPLKNLYSTMGIDRALALWGCVNKYGFPCLIIDGGTALTLTGINQNQELIGGAIFPGLNLQQKALSLYTANLPTITFSKFLPPRWALNTPDAIASGIIYTVLAGISDFIDHWVTQFPQSFIVITGGDRQFLFEALAKYNPNFEGKIIEDSNLIFWGMKHLNLPKMM